MNASSHGLLLLNKKTGVTSFDSLRGIKKAFATGKAGHTGTLDKFASGLLLVLVGRGVKLASLFDNCVKEYTGTVFFGEERDTLDPEGAVIARGPVPVRGEVEAVLESFRGNILQAPPEYSALHVNGRRAHELVREGVQPEMKKRPVTVYELNILSWRNPQAIIHVRCSAGTYIRSLARVIALAAGIRAYLSSLTRIKVGSFCLENAVEDNGSSEDLVKALRPLDRKLFNSLYLPYFAIGEKELIDFFNGKPLERILMAAEAFFPPETSFSRDGGNEAVIPAKNTAAGVFRKETPDDLVGIIENKDGKWSYSHVFK